jgi:hypothetical protein
VLLALLVEAPGVLVVVAVVLPAWLGEVLLLSCVPLMAGVSWCRRRWGWTRHRCCVALGIAAGLFCRWV